MEANAILPDLQSCVLCEDVRCEINGMQTLVGVINADTALHLPDFRAAERTFQLVAQVAGRAGRGPKGGQVYVQTRAPDHPALRAAAPSPAFRTWALRA